MVFGEEGGGDCATCVVVVVLSAGGTADVFEVDIAVDWVKVVTWR